MEALLLGVAIALLAALTVLVLIMLLRKSSATGDVPANLALIAERIAGLERRQGDMENDSKTLASTLAQTQTATTNISKTAESLRTELANASKGVGELTALSKASRDMESRNTDSLRRLEAVIAGTQSRGAAGENIVEALFANLPAEWRAENFRVGNKQVEFGLKLPNDLILPIDSKWTAVNLIEDLAQCSDPDEALKIKQQIEKAAIAKAREVKKYLDPGLTYGFGIAAVPDAVYDLCSGIQIDAYKDNVVLVSYSMFIPYLLLIFQTVLHASREIDMERLAAYVNDVQGNIEAIQEELEGRLSRAIVMLTNSKNDMGGQLIKVRSGLANIQVSTSQSLEATSEVPQIGVPVSKN